MTSRLPSRSTRFLDRDHVTLINKVAGIALCSILSSTAALASSAPITLTAAAKEFAAQALGYDASSVDALHVDPRLPLGDCATGWNFSFAFNSRTTVEVACDVAGSPKRYVALRLPAEPAAATPGHTYVVAAKDLPFGHIVRPSDLKLATPPQGDRPPPQALSSMDDLLGQSLTRPLRAGEAMGRADVRQAILVRRKARVAAWSEFSGGRITTSLISLENGRTGDWIELENPGSGRKVRGQIQADGTVRLGSRRVALSAAPNTFSSTGAKVSAAGDD
jgi:flagella basal body P-ring formation protein FlgA